MGWPFSKIIKLLVFFFFFFFFSYISYLLLTNSFPNFSFKSSPFLSSFSTFFLSLFSFIALWHSAFIFHHDTLWHLRTIALYKRLRLPFLALSLVALVLDLIDAAPAGGRARALGCRAAAAARAAAGPDGPRRCQTG